MADFTLKYQELNLDRGTLRGFLTEPKEPRKDLVVMFHGFTGHKNENGFLFKQFQKLFAEHGIASLRFDFMCSGDSDGDFEDMSFLTEIEDGRNIVEYAYELNNKQPIILLGFSMGGAVAGKIASEYRHIIKKLVLLAPAGCMDILATERYHVDRYNVPEDFKYDLGGFCISAALPKSFQNITVYGDVEKFENPVLICHGELDQSVPIEYGRKYSKLYKNCEFHEIKGAPHCFTRVEYRKEVQEHIIKFLTQKA